MINYFWVVGGLFVIAILCSLFKLRCSNFFIGLCALSFLIYFGVVTYNEKLDFVVVSTENIKVETKGVMTIEIAHTSMHISEYYMSPDATLDDLKKFLKGNKNSVELFISLGDETIYYKNMGRLNEEDAQQILDIYSSWQSEGYLPCEKTHYEFFCFYFDI